MGWFDLQIKSRIKGDQDNFENAFIDLSSVVLGKSKISAAINNDKIKTKNAIEEILKYYRAKIIDLPDTEFEDMNAQMEYLLRPTGIMYRKVNLNGKWWKDAVGPMIGQTKSGDTVALLPSGFSGYKFFNYETGQVTYLNSKTKDLIEDEAICFYQPLPLKKLKIPDLIKFTITRFSKVDFILVIAIMLIAQLLGMIAPWANQQIFGKVVPSGNMGLIIPVTTLLLGMAFSSILISVTKSLIMERIGTKLEMGVQSATMNRIVSLPATFFKDFSAGDLASRVGGIQALCDQLTQVFLGTALPSLFSFAYIFQIGQYAPSLVVPALIIILVQFIFVVVTTLFNIKLSRKMMKSSVKLSGIVFSLFSGIQKIKLSGSERRAFSKWSGTYKDIAQIQYDPPWFIKIQGVFGGIISLVGTLVIYFFAATSGVSQADFIAFNVAYGALAGAVLSLTTVATMYAQIQPTMEMVEPILNTIPETSENKKIVTKISGGIEVNNVSFSYTEDGPKIVDDISLKIKPGQYIAIVGKTGCGKSTLMRLLLGFEKPKKGAVYYDGKDLATLDLRSLRQNIGVVMQNGKLFSGDVFSNIIISAPWLTLEDAWKSAEMAGIAEDIKDMPMGMNTLISEGSGGISGGQKQRLMIARAIAPKPKILMLDEATSALDNITQKQVAESLNGLKNTRIVIAHRLSTIKTCDRIIVLDKGKIIEDGTYDELIKNKGYFAELVERQRLDTEE